MKFKASAYSSLLIIMITVFLLITAQLNLTVSELRISRIHERNTGLYDIGVSAAEARTREINNSLFAFDKDILREYMESNNWQSQCELKDGALVLSNAAFFLKYQEIAKKYINTPDNKLFTITHESGIEISILPNFGNLGTTFGITVTNNSQRPYVKNMTSAVQINGEIKWNPDPPVYTLIPNFNINDETLDGKGFNDFSFTRDLDYTPVILSGVRQV